MTTHRTQRKAVSVTPQKTLFQNVMTYILYLTPIGYFLTYIDLTKGTGGIYLDIIQKNTPIKVIIKKNASLRDRINWLTKAAGLSTQLYYIFTSSLGTITWLYPFMWIGSTYAVVLLITALIPQFPWNHKKYTGFSPFEYLFVGCLVFSAIFPHTQLENGAIQPFNPETFFSRTSACSII